MESNNTAFSLSVLSVVPDKAPNPGHEPGEGATYSPCSPVNRADLVPGSPTLSREHFYSRHFQPFDFQGRIFVTESDGLTGEYITTHGPFFTEEEAMIETVGMTSQEIVENYCTA